MYFRDTKYTSSRKTIEEKARKLRATWPKRNKKSRKNLSQLLSAETTFQTNKMDIILFIYSYIVSLLRLEKRLENYDAAFE